MFQTLFYILLYAVLNVSGAALIKWQLKGKLLYSINEWIQLFGNLPFIVAFLLIVASALALFKALSTNNFSTIVPIATGVNFLLTIAVGYFLFQDKLSLFSFLGFVLIISGVVILSMNNHEHA